MDSSFSYPWRSSGTLSSTSSVTDGKFSERPSWESWWYFWQVMIIPFSSVSFVYTYNYCNTHSIPLFSLQWALLCWCPHWNHSSRWSELYSSPSSASSSRLLWKLSPAGSVTLALSTGGCGRTASLPWSPFALLYPVPGSHSWTSSPSTQTPRLRWTLATKSWSMRPSRRSCRQR